MINRSKERLIGVMYGLIVMAMIAVGWYFMAYAPCRLFKYTEMPGRCVQYFIEVSK